jgi:predicted  nucleic acid-binding Zn-ribbon protein
MVTCKEVYIRAGFETTTRLFELPAWCAVHIPEACALEFQGNPIYNRSMNQANLLYRLQKIDSEIDQIHKRLAEIDHTIKADKSIMRAKLNLQKRQQAVDNARGPLRKIEDSVAALRIKIETNENTLYGGKGGSPKELQDLQNENESLKRRLATLEDEQIEAMIHMEQAEHDQKSAVEELSQAEAHFTSQKAGLMGEHAQLGEKASKLNVEREAFAASISPENISIYQKLREKKRGIAVASIEDKSCSACGSSLRPAEIQQARSTNQMAACSTCGRILFAG